MKTESQGMIMHIKGGLLLYAGMMAALTGMAGMIKIPFYPVPLTLQTMMVYLSGNLLGSRWGMISQLVFLAVGLSGVPVFTNGGGPAYIAQPTFGYLLAFPVAAFIAGTITRSAGMRRLSIFGINMAGAVVIICMGAGYLFFHIRCIAGKTMEPNAIVWSAAGMFIPGEILKAGMAAWLTWRIRPHFRSAQGRGP